jgi:hypothetical protein
MRTCPKCGDYYADDLLAFCLADGTPLVGVTPHSESWNEGVRVVAEKEAALRKQRRRFRWRHVLMSATTTLVMTTVVCVVTVNSLLYLAPGPEEVSRAAASTPAPPPNAKLTTAPPELREPTTADPTPVVPITPASELNPVPTPLPTAAPNPTTDTSTPTGDKQPTPPSTPTPPPSTPTPTPSPTPASTPTPLPTPTPTPTPSPTPTPTPSPSPTPILKPTPAECSDADKAREREFIISEFEGRWRQKIEGDRRKILAENARDAAAGAEASLGGIEYESLFFKSCTVDFITARYTWQVRTNVNGTIRTVTVPKSKRFACVKIGGAWGCS